MQVCECACVCARSQSVQYGCQLGVSVRMSEGELDVGGWDEIQRMDLEIPQDHPVMLLN